MVGKIWLRVLAVVATGGVFASVPTWSAVQEYRKNALAQEARTGLSGIFTAMKRFGGEY